MYIFIVELTQSDTFPYMEVLVSPLTSNLWLPVSKLPITIAFFVPFKIYTYGAECTNSLPLRTSSPLLAVIPYSSFAVVSH